jgi:hypothetical protein
MCKGTFFYQKRKTRLKRFKKGKIYWGGAFWIKKKHIFVGELGVLIFVSIDNKRHSLTQSPRILKI